MTPDLTREQQAALERARARAQIDLTDDQRAALDRARQRQQEIGAQPSLPRRIVNRGNELGRHGLAGIPGYQALTEGPREALGQPPLPSGPPQTAGEAAFRFAGETLPWMVAAPAALAGRAVAGGSQLLAQNAQLLPGIKNAASRGMDSMLRSIQRNPWTSGASEVVSAGGAGAGGFLGAQTDIPGAEAAGLLGGGLLGTLPVAGADFGRRTFNRISTDFFPHTDAGARNIVAPQVQRPAGARYESFVKAIDEAPYGATPADATRDPVLRGLEQRAIQEAELSGIVPSSLQQSDGRRPGNLRHIVEDRRQEGRQLLHDELTRMYGPVRDQNDRMISIVRYGAAPGAENTVQPGPVYRMLDQAYESFRPAYDQFRQAPATGLVASKTNPEVQIPISDAFDEIVGQQGITVSRSARAAVKSVLNDHMSRVQSRVENGQLTTGDIIEVRSGIRNELRELSRNTDTPGLDRRRLLSAAEDTLTRSLESSLGPDELQALRAVDAQYRRHKIIETAVWMGVDDPLSADNLSIAIQQANIPSRYARGADREMRDLAKSWTDITSRIDDPVAMRNLVQEMSPEAQLPIKAEVINTMIARAGGNELTPDGATIPSGTALKREINAFDGTLRAVSMNEDGTLNQTMYAEAKHRLNKIADGLEILQQGNAQAPAELFEQGPAWVFEILPALAGAKLASNLTSLVDVGSGGAFVLAQRIARRFVDQGSRFAMAHPKQLMVDMVLDKDLYQSMLMREGGSPADIERAMRAINAWGLNAMADQERIERANEDLQGMLQSIEGPENRVDPASVGTGWGM